MNIESIIEQIRKRLYVRMDADDETEEQPKRKRGGNTRLPYGLCESEGIGTEGMTPREAWEAYYKKTGVDPSTAYRDHFGKAKLEEKKEKDPFETITEDNVEEAFKEEKRILKEIYDDYDSDVFSLAERGMLKKIGIAGDEEKELVSKLNRFSDLNYKRKKLYGLTKKPQDKYYTSDELNRDSVEECDTINHLMHYMDDKYGIDLQSDFRDKTSLDKVKLMMSGAESMLKEFPDLVGSIKGIDTDESDYGVVMSYVFGKGAFDFFDRTGHIGVNCDLINGEQIKKAVETKKIHPNATVGSVMAHECAHALEHWIVKNAKKTQGIDPMDAMLSHTVANEIIYNAYMTLPKKDQKPSLISKYADSNRAEEIAEAFGDCYANGEKAKNISKAIRKATIDLYNKTKNGEY